MDQQGQDVGLAELGKAGEPTGVTTVHRRAPTADAPEEHLATQTQKAPRKDRMELVRLISAGYSFFVAGVNDGSIGALIPYVVRVYGINTAIVSSL